MSVATGAGGLESGFFERLHHLLLVHMAHRLDAFKARFSDRLELFEHRPFDADGRVHDGFFDVPLFESGGVFVGGECGGGQRGDRQRAAAGLEKFPAVQVCFHNPW